MHSLLHFTRLLYWDNLNIKEITDQNAPPLPPVPIGPSVEGSVLLPPIDSGCAARMRTNKRRDCLKVTLSAQGRSFGCSSVVLILQTKYSDLGMYISNGVWRTLGSHSPFFFVCESEKGRDNHQ